MPYTNGVRKYAYTPNQTPIFVQHRGRNICVGQVVGQTFTKRVQASKHFLRTPRAICLDASSLTDAERAGAALIAIHDDETGYTYTAAIELFKAKSFRVIRGDGNQQGLTLNYWKINGQPSDAERQAEQQVAQEEAARMAQLGLFGGA